MSWISEMGKGREEKGLLDFGHGCAHADDILWYPCEVLYGRWVSHLTSPGPTDNGKATVSAS